MNIDRGCERILHWLHRYPLQRVADLVVALGPWEGRGAVYRRVAALEAEQLIEACHLGDSSRGKRLYHLTPKGLTACTGVPPSLPEERGKLVRLFPQMRVHLRVQDLVNSLVSGSTQALAKRGRFVRWNWLRDYAHGFVEQESHRPLALRAEGALALCVQGSAQPDLWYTLLLMYCPLSDIRLMISRFDRLLRFRESTERRHVYSQMPPVLIEAHDAHQAELWQLACAQVAARLRVAIPVGAVASVDACPIDGWRLPWKRLFTDESCQSPGSASNMANARAP